MLPSAGQTRVQSSETDRTRRAIRGYFISRFVVATTVFLPATSLMT